MQNDNVHVHLHVHVHVHAYNVHMTEGENDLEIVQENSGKIGYISTHPQSPQSFGNTCEKREAWYINIHCTMARTVVRCLIEPAVHGYSRCALFRIEPNNYMHVRHALRWHVSKWSTPTSISQ